MKLSHTCYVTAKGCTEYTAKKNSNNKKYYDVDVARFQRSSMRSLTTFVLVSAELTCTINLHNCMQLRLGIRVAFFVHRTVDGRRAFSFALPTPSTPVTEKENHRASVPHTHTHSSTNANVGAAMCSPSFNVATHTQTHTHPAIWHLMLISLITSARISPLRVRLHSGIRSYTTTGFHEWPRRV